MNTTSISTHQELVEEVFKEYNKKYDNTLLALTIQINDPKLGDISNSHVAPKGKPTNFLRSKDLPTSYRGWSGRIWIIYKRIKNNDHDAYDRLKEFNIHTGTGGYGSYNHPNKLLFYNKNLSQYRMHSSQGLPCYPLSYYIRYFVADFPSILLWEAIEPNTQTLFHFEK